jgi:hypothetical protein
MASEVGLTRMHFAAQFKAATDLRPHEYLLRPRIERAQEMLVGTDMSLVDVALAVGFQTQSHFTTIFRRFRRPVTSCLARVAGQRNDRGVLDAQGWVRIKDAGRLRFVQGPLASDRICAADVPKARVLPDRKQAARSRRRGTGSVRHRANMPCALRPNAAHFSTAKSV